MAYVSPAIHKLYTNFEKINCKITMKYLFLILSICAGSNLIGQTNLVLTSTKSVSHLKGDFNPQDYNLEGLNHSKSSIIETIQKEINADSLKAYIIKLSEFRTRHSASDTMSTFEGIGAARRWSYTKFKEFTPASKSRLEPGYLQFDQDICGVLEHRNIVATLPGKDTSLKDVILIEAHLDSRCETNCDITCDAQGVEDNATGSALVIELARVLSKCIFDRTIVFMLTIGEEQGLIGSGAFVKYAQENNIQIRAVLNNDVVGSTICGKTASQPGCNGEGEIDSTQFRIFSSGNFNSPHKQFARFSKLQYNQEIKPSAGVPMDITIMSAEDRTGRGGDHIPFRRNGFTAVRYTAANEHGDASVGAGYTDRQHTSRDTLGTDTDKDGIIDNYFIDFNYLKRNSQINAISVFGAAASLPTPEAEFFLKWGNNVVINIKDGEIAPYYALAYRAKSNDWDSIIVLKGARQMDAWVPTDEYLSVSIAALNNEGLESLFSKEARFLPLSTKGIEATSDVELFANYPNPFDETTTISVVINKPLNYQSASIKITNSMGQAIRSIPMELKMGLNEINYSHGFHTSGIYFYSLVVDGKKLITGKMIFK